MKAASVHRRAAVVAALLALLASCAAPAAKNAGSAPDKRSPREIAEAAQVFYEYKEWRRALREYESLIVLYGAQRDKFARELAWAWYETGFCQLNLGDKKKARDSFQKVMNEFTEIAPRTLAEQRLIEIDQSR